MALANDSAADAARGRGRRRPRLTVLGTFLATALFLCAPVLAKGADFVPLPDFPVPNGHFYTQASGQGIGFGFPVVDDGGVLFYDEFTRLGGVDKVGYPASQRFQFGGFTSQLTQKQVLQWRPESGHVDFVNIFDVFSQRGLDPTLAQSKLIPPTQDNSPDAHLTWAEVIRRHLALLDRDPAIRAAYFADADPVADFGLPQGVGDFGGVLVIRCERAAFQHWRVATSFAGPGDVTQVNAGDLAKELGIVTAEATTPSPTAGQLVAPPGALIGGDQSVQAAARQSAAAAMPSLVRIDVTFASATGVASGIVLDQTGHVLTNEHVVDSALSIKVTYANGISLGARVVGSEVVDDLALLQVTGAIGGGVKPAVLTSSRSLSPGQFVVAVGYSPFFPVVPATRLGIFQRTIADTVTIIRTDTFILPGDSGGMLLDLAGNVVGVNDEIRFTDQTQQPLIGFSIDAADAAQVAQRLLRGR